MTDACPTAPLDDVKHLWIVIGSDLEQVDQKHYRDASKVTFYGAFDDHAAACSAWHGASMANVDNAHYRVLIVPVY